MRREYKCHSCKCVSAFRLPMKISQGYEYGGVVCQHCAHNYLTWLNADEVIKYLQRNDPEYRSHYPLDI